MMGNFPNQKPRDDPKNHQCRKYVKTIMKIFEDWFSGYNFFELDGYLVDRVKSGVWRLAYYKCYNVDVLHVISKLVESYPLERKPEVGDVVLYDKKIYWVEISGSTMYLNDPAKGIQVWHLKSNPILLFRGDDWIRIVVEFGKLLAIFVAQTKCEEAFKRIPPKSYIDTPSKYYENWTELVFPETLNYDQKILIWLYKNIDF